MVKAMRPCVATQKVCRDRVAQRVHTNACNSVRDRHSVRTVVRMRDKHTTERAQKDATKDCRNREALSKHS